MKHWLVLAAFASLAFAQDFDILIINGRIVDGTGNPSYQADLGIRAGRIAAIGRLSTWCGSRLRKGAPRQQSHMPYTMAPVIIGSRQSIPTRVIRL